MGERAKEHSSLGLSPAWASAPGNQPPELRKQTQMSQLMAAKQRKVTRVTWVSQAGAGPPGKASRICIFVSDSPAFDAFIHSTAQEQFPAQFRFHKSIIHNTQPQNLVASNNNHVLVRDSAAWAGLGGDSSPLLLGPYAEVVLLISNWGCHTCGCIRLARLEP